MRIKEGNDGKVYLVFIDTVDRELFQRNHPSFAEYKVASFGQYDNALEFAERKKVLERRYFK